MVHSRNSLFNFQATQVTENDAQQAIMAQLLSRMHENQTSTFPGNPANFDSPNLMLPRMELSAKDRQVSGNNDFQVPDDWFPYFSKKLDW